jgi:hypothetical protein
MLRQTVDNRAPLLLFPSFSPLLLWRFLSSVILCPLYLATADHVLRRGVSSRYRMKLSSVQPVPRPIFEAKTSGIHYRAVIYLNAVSPTCKVSQHSNTEKSTVTWELRGTSHSSVILWPISQPIHSQYFERRWNSCKKRSECWERTESGNKEST